jgi:hypothetical protein
MGSMARPPGSPFGGVDLFGFGAANRMALPRPEGHGGGGITGTDSSGACESCALLGAVVVETTLAPGGGGTTGPVGAGSAAGAAIRGASAGVLETRFGAAATPMGLFAAGRVDVVAG